MLAMDGKPRSVMMMKGSGDGLVMRAKLGVACNDVEFQGRMRARIGERAGAMMQQEQGVLPNSTPRQKRWAEDLNRRRVDSSGWVDGRQAAADISTGRAQKDDGSDGFI